LFFRPEHCGMSKTEASQKTLEEINPDVRFETYNFNILSVGYFDQFLDRIQHGGIDGTSPVDLVLGCVDNYEARVGINQACTELGKSWMESGVSEDAMSGHIQFIVPGKTACFQCAPPLVVASGIDERTLKREGVCAASLPTTMSMVAGMLIQNTLKYLLGFGEVAYYLGYNALKDFFPTYMMKPNPSCDNRHCLTSQEHYREFLASLPKEEPKEDKSVEIVHTDNEWQIEVIDTSSEQLPEKSTGEQQPPAGTQFLYDGTKPKVNQSECVDGSNLEDLSSLMKSLSNLSNK